MKLIVGLGNPGPQYVRTRHNAGFMAVDQLARRHAPNAVVRARFQADCIEASIRGEKCLLVKPVTYMNRSGQSVVEAVQFYKVLPADLMVITDDVALPVGAIRLRADGSPGGHNGLADIQQRLATPGYPRCRVGIGPKPPQFIQSDFVLSRFAEEERPGLEASIQTAADAVEVFVAEGIDAAMNRFNTRIKEPSGPSGESPDEWPGTE